MPFFQLVWYNLHSNNNYLLLITLVAVKVMDIYLPASWLGKHPLLFTSTSVNTVNVRVLVTWILWYFIARCGKIRVAVTGCRRWVVRVKRKLMAWKNFWRARLAEKHSKTPLGVTTELKRQWTTAIRSYSFFCFFLGTLRSFMNIN